MRKAMQLWTDQTADGLAILWPEETATSTGHWWLTFRPRDDLILTVNEALTGPQLINPIALFFFFEMLPYNRDAFCNADPDFSGYSQWIKLRDGK